jgi:arylformamidase
MVKIENQRNYYDISPPLNTQPALFPGDTKFKQSAHMNFETGDHLMLSSIEMSLHTGAHVDAPCHYAKGADSISAANLNTYMGKCQVIEVDLVPGASITPEDINSEEINCQRVLFKTNSFPYNGVWHEEFNSISASLIHLLAKKNVVLVGIDTPSIDPATSKNMDAHKAIHESSLRILEGIDLEAVKAGKYELIALPLNIEGADASPVRAILIDKGMH